MVPWNLHTLRFGGACTPQSSSDKVIGPLGMDCMIFQKVRRPDLLDVRECVKLMEMNDTLLSLFLFIF